MGHSSINMTFDLYGHLYDDTDADRDAMKKIEAAINATRLRHAAENFNDISLAARFCKQVLPCCDCRKRNTAPDSCELATAI
jgi:hypothetical protein